MSIRSIVHELKEMRDGIGSMSRRGFEGKSIYHGRARSHSVFELHHVQGSSPEQGVWTNLPQELLVDVIRRIEASETSWPARKHVVACAAVCKSWREVTKEIVKTPEQCGRLTFPISLKQPGPRDSPIQCFIRRERETSMFYLYLGLSPGENGKLLLSARKIRRRPASPDFSISLDASDFSRTSNSYVGKLRSSRLLGNKFTVYDSQPQNDGMVMPFLRSIKRLQSKKISPKLPAGNFNAATISYDFNFLGTRGTRRMRCTMNSIPISCIQDGGAASTSTGCSSYIDESFSMLLPAAKFMDPTVEFSSTSLCVPPVSSLGREEPLTLKNKAQDGMNSCSAGA